MKETLDGDIFTHWLGRGVKIYSLQGGDGGEIGFGPEDRSWFHAGDLIRTADWKIEGRGFGEKEKGAREYAENIKRIIDTDPLFIIPSHGMPLGGTCYLKKILDSLSGIA